MFFETWAFSEVMASPVLNYESIVLPMKLVGRQENVSAIVSIAIHGIGIFIY